MANPELEIDISDGTRLFLKTETLGELFIKESPEGIRISTDSKIIAIIPNGNNSFILQDGKLRK